MINGSVALDERDRVVASLEQAADAAEDRLEQMANETRAAFKAAQQVPSSGESTRRGLRARARARQ